MPFTTFDSDNTLISVCSSGKYQNARFDMVIEPNAAPQLFKSLHYPLFMPVINKSSSLIADETSDSKVPKNIFLSTTLPRAPSLAPSNPALQKHKLHRSARMLRLNSKSSKHNIRSVKSLDTISPRMKLQLRNELRRTITTTTNTTVEKLTKLTNEMSVE